MFLYVIYIVKSRKSQCLITGINITNNDYNYHCKNMDIDNDTLHFTRDDRFKRQLRKDLGEKGIPLLVNQAVIFMFALIIVVSIMIGITNMKSNDNYGKQNLKYSVLLPH